MELGISTTAPKKIKGWFRESPHLTTWSRIKQISKIFITRIRYIYRSCFRFRTLTALCRFAVDLTVPCAVRLSAAPFKLCLGSGNTKCAFVRLEWFKCRRDYLDHDAAIRVSMQHFGRLCRRSVIVLDREVWNVALPSSKSYYADRKLFLLCLRRFRVEMYNAIDRPTTSRLFVNVRTTRGASMIGRWLRWPVKPNVAKKIGSTSD